MTTRPGSDEHLHPTAARRAHSWDGSPGRDILSRLIRDRHLVLGRVWSDGHFDAVGFSAGCWPGIFGLAGHHDQRNRRITWGFPLILMAMILTGAFGPGLISTVLAIGLVNWAGLQVIRGEVISYAIRNSYRQRTTGPVTVGFCCGTFFPEYRRAGLVMASYYVAPPLLPRRPARLLVWARNHRCRVWGR